MTAGALVGFEHRRLSILELSAAGAQPMISVSGRYIISFNGKIYIYLDLRNTLAGFRLVISWRCLSDTETFLAGFDV